MRWPRAAAVAATTALAVLVATAGGAGQAGPVPLPRPIYTNRSDDQLTAMALEGSHLALGVGCRVLNADLSHAVRFRAQTGSGWCDDQDNPATLLLGSDRTLVVLSLFVDHGDSYQLWQAPLAGARFTPLGDDWGWYDFPTTRYGCGESAAAGGGTIVYAQGPNGVGELNGLGCAAHARTILHVSGRGAPATLTLQHSWAVVATDGKRVVLARLDDTAGTTTGEGALLDLTSDKLTPLGAGSPDISATVEPGYVFDPLVWLTNRGLVVETNDGFAGSGWSVKAKADAATYFDGRLFWLAGRTIWVRRLRDGAQRGLALLPAVPRRLVPDTSLYLSSGTSGLVAGTSVFDPDAYSDSVTSRVYLLPWRTVDTVLPR